MTIPGPRLWRHRSSLALIFFVNAAIGANFAGRIPDIKRTLDLSTGALGSILLAVAAGMLAATAFSVRVLHGRGSVSMAVTGAIVGAAALALVGQIHSAWQLMVALWLMGVGLGLCDIAMNANASALEAEAGFVLMGSLHAFFSIGIAVGWLMATAALALDLSLATHLTLAAAGLGGLAVFSRSWLFDGDPEPQPHERLRWSPLIVALTACTAASVFVEGTTNDWSALYLEDTHGVSRQWRSSGSLAFFLAGFGGRLAVDAVTRRVGSKSVVVGGGTLITAGSLLVVTAGPSSLVVVGYALAGFGISGIFPEMVRSASRVPGIPAASAVALVAGGGYVALFAGPPTVGWVAEATTMRTGLCLSVAAGVLVIAIGAWALRRLDRDLRSSTP